MNIPRFLRRPRPDATAVRIQRSGSMKQSMTSIPGWDLLDPLDPGSGVAPLEEDVALIDRLVARHAAAGSLPQELGDLLDRPISDRYAMYAHQVGIEYEHAARMLERLQAQGLEHRERLGQIVARKREEVAAARADWQAAYLALTGQLPPAGQVTVPQPTTGPLPEPAPTTTPPPIPRPGDEGSSDDSEQVA